MRMILSDLDGTLLDSAYRFDAARPALECCRKKGALLVPVSSKTLPEMAYWSRELALPPAFSYENGFGIAFREAQPAWLKPRVLDRYGYRFQGTAREAPGWRVWEQEIGSATERIRQLLERFPKGTVRFATELSAKEWVRITGLSPELAEKARRRRGIPPLWISPEVRSQVVQAFREAGFRVGRGRFFVTVAPYDKGTVAEALVRALRARHPHARVLALGDQPADEAMAPYVDRFVKVHGPKEWNRVVWTWLACDGGEP